MARSPLRHLMVRDLAADPPPPGWAAAPGPDGVAFVSLDAVRDEELVPGWAAAYPREHLDYVASDVPIEYLREILSGRELGPLMACSRVARAGEQVVGAVLITDGAAQPPDWAGGAFVADLFRDPGPRWAGVGAALLRRALAGAAQAGAPRAGLRVTEGNPARRLYDALGFRVVATTRRRPQPPSA